MPLIAALRKTLFSLRGNNKFNRLDELLKMQYLSTEELRTIQFAELSKLINHAYSTTVYYNKVFKELGITPNDIKSFEDYAKLPLLTKDILQENLEDLCSSKFPKESRTLNSSGGTTGKPAQFYQDSQVAKELEAHFLLMLSLAGWTPDDMVVSLWGNPRELLSSSTPKHIKPWLSGMVTLNAYRYDTKSMEMWVKVFKRYKRVLLYGYSTVITDFAKYCMKNNITLPIFAVMTTAEILEPNQRESIEKAFSCKVFDQYGAREMPGVASECEHGNMHLYTSAAYAEFLPVEDSNTTLEQQKIILTSLNNYTMPMLRYEIGDLAAPKNEQCACGRGYPLMQMEVGRIGASLKLPEGGRLYSTMFVRQMYHITGIEAFQYRQTELRHVDLYIVKNDTFTSQSEEKLNELILKFPISVCPGANLQLHYVEDIPRTIGGKHRQVICEVTE